MYLILGQISNPAGLDQIKQADMLIMLCSTTWCAAGLEHSSDQHTSVRCETQLQCIRSTPAVHMACNSSTQESARQQK
jgi:hypothetical protein